MSHTVTVTRTTTTSGNTSYIVINTGYFKSIPGLLKLLELILGIICVGIISYYFDYSLVFYVALKRSYEIFFLCITVTFMIGTFLIVLACLISLGTGTIMSKTIFEVVYHLFAGILLIIAGLIVVITISDYNVNKDKYNCTLAAGIIALVNGVLYLISTFFANKSYRGI
ncbi:uncharacterized protein LOC129618795 isoform X1 [Condylostylus longicornis]|uniref:uncharacterized protein LOC129618795 isoform X1 n=1 Tax=Condylostylus longicornis TaxID=2530218 RepID=UPI00244E2411|nr:uncharacterized protein LOC129618795 isoform X1 [Condylostylus longicornis]